MSAQNERDLSLFKSIKAGNQQAFRQLFDLYYESLVFVAFRLLRDMNSAKDMVQEVFLTLWKKRQLLEIHSFIYAYLKRSVVNKSLNYIKARKHFEEDTVLERASYKTSSAQESMEAKDLETLIKKTIDTLPERCRAVFVLKRFEDKSLKEIGALLDISPKTVEHQMTKALKVLKNAVIKYQQQDRG